MSNPYIHLIKYSWQYAKGRRHIFILASFMSLIANSIYMLEPLVLAKLLNTLQRGEEDLLYRSTLLLLLFASINLFFWIFHGPARIMERNTAFLIRKNYVQDIFQKITQLPLKWHKNHHSGETYDKVDKAQKALYEFAGSSFQHIETMVRLLGATIAIIFFLPVYGVMIIFLGFFIIVVLSRFDRVLIKHRERINQNDHHISSILFDYISNITTVITLRLESLSKNEVLHRIIHIFPTYNRSIRINEWKWFCNTILVTFTALILMFLYLYQHISAGETILIGSFIALFEYLSKFSGAFFNIAWQYEEVVWRSTDVHSADTILIAHQKLSKPSKIQKMPDKWQTIHITDLSFRYEDEKHHIHHMDNVNITLQKKQRIALVGKSGSGKSTLMTLLRGLEKPDQIHLAIDGLPFENLSILSDTTTLIPQDPEIFENTIAYNISAGLPHKKTEVSKAVRLACFQKVLKKLPSGLNTSMREKGVNLSGGEKQRLALARGILAAKDSTILLLDEPTSSVDPINERLIYQNIFTNFKTHCIVSSVHRLHLLPLFDYIYVLGQGKVLEQGSFRELIQNKKGALHKMWQNYKHHDKN